MFKMSEIKELVNLIDKTSVQELEIENEGSRICIRKSNRTEMNTQNYPGPATLQSNVQPQNSQQSTSISEQMPAPAENENNKASNLHTIISPMVGTFYTSPSPNAPAFAKRGDKINEKTVVCIIEAMKLMNEIEAEVKGEIVEILVDNGQLVEFGQPLFIVNPI